MLEGALELLRGGLSILPVKADGTKAPAIPTFDAFKRERRATEDEVRAWFSDGAEKGVGVLCGRMSGNLVVLDFETKGVYASWSMLAEGEIKDFGELPVVNSPRGVHVYARLPKPVGGKKLAMEYVEVEDKDTGLKTQKRQTLIEFRGDGQYVVGPGSPGSCHPSGVGWVHRGGVDVSDAPKISMGDWDILCRIAMSFNQAPERENIVTGMAKVSKDDVRPGSDYCFKSGLPEWRQLLEKHGWECLREDARSRRQIWKRPGKEQPGGSATLGFCTTDLGLVLYVFSTNADPFHEDRAYNIFSARALLEFDGQYDQCARFLQKEGFGEAAREDVRSDVESQISKLRTLQEEGALGMSDQIKGWCVVRKFKDLWERKRKDLGDDIHRYEICLLLFAYQKLGTPEESGIVKGLRLVRLWRERYDEDPDKIFDVDYAAKKVEWILNRPDRGSEDEVLTEHEAGKAGKTMDARFSWLSSRLDFEIRRFVQVGPNSKEATFHFVTRSKEGAPRWVRVGPIEDLRDPNKVEAAIQSDVDERGRRVPDFPGAFKEEVMTKFAWRGILRVLLCGQEGKVVCDVEEPGGRRRQVLSWVEEYSEAKGAHGQTDEDQLKNAIKGHRPYLEDGNLCVQLEQFTDFVRTQRGQRFTDLVMRDLFRAAGFKRFRKYIRIDGKQLARYYWRIPLDRLPSSDSEVETAQENHPTRDI